MGTKKLIYLPNRKSWLKGLFYPTETMCITEGYNYRFLAPLWRWYAESKWEWAVIQNVVVMTTVKSKWQKIVMGIMSKQ